MSELTSLYQRIGRLVLNVDENRQILSEWLLIKYSLFPLRPIRVLFERNGASLGPDQTLAFNQAVISEVEAPIVLSSTENAGYFISFESTNGQIMNNCFIQKCTEGIFVALLIKIKS